MPSKFALTVELHAHHLSLHPVHGAGGAGAGILNTWSRFALPAFTPVLLNLSLIGCAVCGTVFRSAGAGAGLGGVPRRHAATWPAFPHLQTLGMLPRFRLGSERPGRAADTEVDGPAVFGRFGIVRYRS